MPDFHQKTVPYPLTPDTAIITFDLHGVLFKNDYVAILKIMIASKYKWAVATHALNPKFLRFLIKLWRRSSPTEQYIMHATEQWPGLANCKNDLLAIANAQKPNIPMLNLVRELHMQGYELHIFSNIGTILLADLQKKFPELSQLFSHMFTTSAEIGYPSKCHSEFFKTYHASLDKKKKKTIVFIDDSHKNIQTGYSFGMLGIYSKNSESVRDQLKQLGVMR